MPTEIILFNKGLSYDSRSALKTPGFLQTATNIQAEVDGAETLRHLFTAMNTTKVNSVHSICRFRDIIVIGDSTYLRFASATTDEDFTDIGSGFANAPWKFREYKDFLFCTNGTDQVLVDASGNAYPAQLDIPGSSPSGAAGAGGNPNGHYYLYVSFLVTYPNGHKIETGLCAGSADVNVSSQKISWTNIPTMTYAAYQGTAPTIHRKLYRGPGTGGTLTDIYYVATISDNTTTTYTDDSADSTLIANDASVVDDYEALPDSHFIEFHYGRAYAIKHASPNRLVYAEQATDSDPDVSEAIFPVQTTDANWDDLRVSAFERTDPMDLIAWGPYLYVPFRQTWIRKFGEDPDTWSWKKTWAKHGVGASLTTAICAHPMGIIYLATPDGGEPGIALFNGQSSQMLTSPLLDYVFKTDLDHTKIDYCRGFCAGHYYHFLYPSTEAAGNDPDKWLVLDLRRFPEIRAFYWSFTAGYPVCGWSYNQGNTYYVGTTDGYVKRMDTASAETMSVSVQTAERVGGDVKLANKEKTLKTLKYNLDSGGDSITLTIYINGTAATWSDGTTSKAINGTGDSVQVLPLPVNFKGYRYSLSLSGSGLDTFTLYGPWEMEFDVTA